MKNSRMQEHSNSNKENLKEYVDPHDLDDSACSAIQVDQNNCLISQPTDQLEPVLAPDSVLIPESVLISGIVVTPGQISTTGSVLTQEQVLTQESVLTSGSVDTPGRVLTPKSVFIPGPVVTQGELLTPESVLKLEQVLAPESVLEPNHSKDSENNVVADDDDDVDDNDDYDVADAEDLPTVTSKCGEEKFLKSCDEIQSNLMTNSDVATDTRISAGQNDSEIKTNPESKKNKRRIKKAKKKREKQMKKEKQLKDLAAKSAGKSDNEDKSKNKIQDSFGETIHRTNITRDTIKILIYKRESNSAENSIKSDNLTDQSNSGSKDNFANQNRHENAKGKVDGAHRNGGLADINKSRNETKQNKHDDKILTLHFHAGLSTDFKFKSKDELVYIVFFDRKGTQIPHLIEDLNSEDSKGSILFVDGTISIKFGDLKNQSEYKYAILRNGKMKFEQITSVWNHNRKLNMKHLEECIENGFGLWHQYDGMARPSASYSTFWDWKKTLYQLRELLTHTDYSKVFQDSKRFSLRVLPDFENLGRTVDGGLFTAEEILKQIGHICKCITSYFLDVNGDTLSGDELRLILKEYLETILTKMETQLLNKSNETAEQSIHRAVKKSLQQFINNNCRNPSFMFAVPLFHFLAGNSKPFQWKFDANQKHNTGIVWWGADGIQQATGSIAKKPKELVEAIPVCVGKLGPLFEVDYLLPRTVMSVVSNFDQLDKLLQTRKFPPDACLALINWFVVNYHGTDIYDRIQTGLMTVTETMVTWKDSFCDKNDEIYSKTCELCDISYNLLCALCSRTSRQHNLFDFVLSGIGIFFISICQLLQLDDLRSHLDVESDLKKKVNGRFNNGKEQIIKWLIGSFPRSLIDSYSHNECLINPQELKILDKILNCEIENEALNKSWTETFENHLSKQLDDIKNPEDLVRIYAHTDLKVFASSKIENCFCSKAFQAITQVCNSPVVDDLLKFCGENGTSEKLNLLMSKVLEKSWPESDKNSVVLKHVLSWSPFVQFLKFTCSKAGKILDLSDECKLHIALGVSVLSTIASELCEGMILIQNLKDILSNERQFVSICVCMIDNGLFPLEVPDVDMHRVVPQVVTWRKEELQEYDRQQKLVEFFLGHCGELKNVDVSLLKEKLKNPARMRLSEVCEARVHDLSHHHQYLPNVTYFGLNRDAVRFLEELKNLSTSQLFHNIWIRHGRVYDSRIVKNDSDLGSEDDDCDDHEVGLGEDSSLNVIENVLKNVWLPSKEEWKSLCSGMKNGNVGISKVNDLFQEFERDYDTIEKELKFMGLYSHVVKERLQQIELMNEANFASKGAKVILDAKAKFKLYGDFQDLEVLNFMATKRNTGEEDLPLSSISNTLVEGSEKLKNITPEKIKCLNIYLDNIHLANWLKETVKQDELTTLIDLAMVMATGEGDVQVEYVRCLHSAVLGYSPFIYSLKENINFDEFLKICSEVWQTLERDPDLPTRFESTAKNMEFLKEIQESQGCAETNALTVTKRINATGMFTVGHIMDSLKDLDDVIVLKYTIETKTVEPELKSYEDDDDDDKNEGRNEEKKREMNLQKLDDLQSKLMLVVGREDEINQQVDQFVEVFDLVKRLAKTYQKICSAGCMLFHDWKAVIFCNKEKNPNVYVEFGASGQSLKARGGDPTSQIRDLCDCMDELLESWLEHVDQQHSEFYHLNYFTAKQLMILQEGLAILNEEDRDRKVVDRLVFPILSLISENFDQDDLSQSFSRASNKLLNIDSDSEDVEDEENDDEDDGLISLLSGLDEEEQNQRKNFIDKMLESGYSRSLAVRALSSGIDAGEIGEGVMWCMEEQDRLEDSSLHSLADRSIGDESNLSSLSLYSREHSRNQSFQVSSTFANVTTEILEQFSRDEHSTLTGQLKTLWDSFLREKVTTSTSDFLSLRHVGFILDALVDNDEQLDISRPLPKYLKNNQPNLIVCSKSSVFSTLLSIYAFDHGAELPLPGVDEVLLCTSTTTVEDVELIIRRAKRDKDSVHPQKTYCLVFAELLTYDVACKSEELITKFLTGNQNFQFVVICSTEFEGQSHMISALDKYRVHQPIVFVNEVKDYLAKKLTAKSSEYLNVDPDRSSVRLIKSHRSGVGKTLKVHRLRDQLRKKRYSSKPSLVTIAIHSKFVNHSKVFREFLWHTLLPGEICPRIFHIDVAHEVEQGVDHLLFNLLVLGTLTGEDGYVWRKKPEDLYLIENMPLMQKDLIRRHQEPVHQIISLLPSMTCWSPQDCLDIAENQEDFRFRYPDWKENPNDQLMDVVEFKSPVIQRPYQYLDHYSRNILKKKIKVARTVGSPEECIKCLLKHCGIEDPSWSELHNFASFLNVQLMDCEESSYCMDFFADDLPGFVPFVVKFMIRMSRDFATRSLKVSDQSPGLPRNYVEEFVQQDQAENEMENLLQNYELKRRWETSSHPYLFFNSDHHSFSFMGFYVDRHTLSLHDARTKKELEKKIMPQNLNHALFANKVNLQEDFDSLSRAAKIEKICNVIGQNNAHDPDPTYELMSDNVKKILAIFMRFRCKIPVVIMGETGCGKTRLVKFMCDLWKPPGADVQNMVLVKVHGGTTQEDIVKKLEEAIEISRRNKRLSKQENETDEQNVYTNMGTVLFFDEANTTEAIGIIKEIMCDGTYLGRPLPDTHGLHIIAACNPYRKHSDTMIGRLEKAGLGYHVRADETQDRFGRIPMRQLVYRVQALPQSLLPLVWDFGQLQTDVESAYIRQMVNRHFKAEAELTLFVDQTTRILTAAQQFMREQEDECHFVSLRDVERTLSVMMWFYRTGEMLFKLMNEKILKSGDPGLSTNSNRRCRSLILALGVCYHACLENSKENPNRRRFRERIAKEFDSFNLRRGEKTILDEITICQEVFLDNAGSIGQNIARNQALKENVFMMVVCIELRIPLFLVGKPGSSKSLAKKIIMNAMQGKSSQGSLFKEYKASHLISFQCSPLSTPEGIVAVFRQCAELQEKQDLDKYVAVVVLDEVGLAEDSPKMPLKTLHPLLEYGYEFDGKIENHSKVAFIGISNWALDPAKINRGILVQRGEPDEEELEETARGICSEQKEHVRGICKEQKDHETIQRMNSLIKSLTSVYMDLYEEGRKNSAEFFGLRDFYSLIKMVYTLIKTRKDSSIYHCLEHAVMRNFDGLEHVKPLEIFEKHFLDQDIFVDSEDSSGPNLENDLEHTTRALIRASLEGIGLDKSHISESRYLLILTENYAALDLLQQQLTTLKDAISIFGSSFKNDQEYTQVCRNINRIKICMEAGRTVVLLNLENLYESLYDALNQYYMHFNGQKFVDLGLGTQRVKCKVHDNFRLIVVAEKEVVYKQFPIPLINRLEKHILSMESMLTKNQSEMAKELEKWVTRFSSTDMYNKSSKQIKPSEVFIGYRPDTAASIILYVCNMIGQNPSDDIGQNQGSHDNSYTNEVLEKSKFILLQSATPDSLLRLPETALSNEAEKLQKIYLEKQHHDSLLSMLKEEVCRDWAENREPVFLQVSTHSLLLSHEDFLVMVDELGFQRDKTVPHSLQNFNNELQFCNVVKEAFQNAKMSPDCASSSKHLFFLQCDESVGFNGDLISCARYNISNEYSQLPSKDLHPIFFVFVIQLSRLAAGNITLQCGKWKSYHIDDLHVEKERLPDLFTLKKLTVSQFFSEAIKSDVHLPRVSDDDEEENKETSRSLRQDMEGDSEDENEFFDTEDVDLELRNPRYDKTEKIRENESKVDIDFDVGILISGCLQRAEAMVRDSDTTSSGKNRKTERLNILLELLKESSTSEEGVSTLMDVIKIRLVDLLRDREKSCSVPEQAGRWLMSDVCARDSITHSGGTFRRSLWQYLESKVTPLLTGIIAYIDTNANINLFNVPSSESPSAWKRKLWLKMFCNPDVSGLRYRDMQSATRKNDLTEFQVTNRGCDGQFIENSFPFSWVIKDQIDLVLHTRNQSDVKVHHLLRETPLAQVLRASTFDVSEQVNCYLKDYVKMIYKPCSFSPDLEYQFICQEFKQAMKNDDSLIDGTTSEDRLLNDILTIHNISRQLTPRLKIFNEIMNVWPDCIDEIRRIENLDSLPLDLKSLMAMLTSLTDGAKELDKSEVQRDWLDRVKNLFPLIQRLLDGARIADDGLHIQDQIEKCCNMWNRIRTVQLFIEHICLVDGIDPYLIKKQCMLLWNLLGANADLRKIRTLDKLEKFVTKKKKDACIYYQNLMKCPFCGKQPTRPQELPCGHVLCKQCVDEMIEAGIGSCPADDGMCKEKISVETNLQAIQSKRKEEVHLEEFEQRCNEFLMDVIFSLCFLGGCSPEGETVNKLFEYVTMDDRTVEEDGAMKLTPVVRSFVFQVLLQFENHDNVKTYFDEYFNKALERFDNKEPVQIAQLCLLMVHCLEDYYRCQLAMKPSVDQQIRFVLELFRENSIGSLFSSKELNINKLEMIGKMRFILSQSAIWMYEFEIRIKLDSTGDQSDVQKSGELPRLLERLHIYTAESSLKWPRLYLIKQIGNLYGMEAMRQLADTSLSWILPPEANSENNDTIPDRYIVCGDMYKELRQQVTEIALGSSCDNLKQLMNSDENSCGMPKIVRICWMLLAISKEVTLNYRLDEQQRPTSSVIEELTKFCDSNLAKSEKALKLARQLINNTLPGSRLNIHPNQTTQDLSLMELLVHILVFMSVSKNKKYLQPLVRLIFEPSSMQGSLFPTMPQDHVLESKLAIIEAQKKTNAAGETMAYACPNGHPYFIGDCGNPDLKRPCPECGLSIGGVAHNLEPGNTKLDILSDQTRPGHILGPAHLRSKIATGERDMNPAETAIIRLLLHSSMYLGALDHEQDVFALIDPKIPDGYVEKFLMPNIRADLRDIGSSLGKNEDDVLLLLHILLQNATCLSPQELQQHADVTSSLTTNDERQKWETTTSRIFVAPVLKNADERLKTAQMSIVNDKTRLGTNPFLKLLYEADVSENSTELGRIEEGASMWYYRAPISLASVAQKLQTNENNQKFALLKLFLREESKLGLLKHLPGIVKLLRLIRQHFTRKIGRWEAGQIKISSDQFKEIFEHVPDMFGEVEALIDNFKLAWNSVRHHLNSFVFRGGRRLSTEMCELEVNEETRLNMLLPSSQGQGLCVVALVSYLCQIQNKFMEEVGRITQRSLKSIDVQEVGSSQVIVYDVQKDILPLLLANCSYSLKAGQGTTIEFKFVNLEKQIEERHIRGKPLLDSQKLENIVFSDDSSYAKLFKQLNKRIKQEPLPSNWKQDIEAELRKDRTKLKDSLSNLDTALGFLVSVGGKPSREIQRFMTDTLNMKKGLSGEKTRHIPLKQFESLWLTLAHLLAKLDASFNQDSFDCIDEKYRAEISDGQKKELVEAFQDQARADDFLSILFECIHLHLTSSDQDVDHERSSTKQSLKIVLNAYAEGKDISVDWNLPESIKVEHCLSTWRHLTSNRPRIKH